MIDELIDSGDIVKVTSLPETKTAVEEEISQLNLENNFTYDGTDQVRQAINARALSGIKPIRVDMSQTDLGFIQKPVFLSPNNHVQISRHNFSLVVGPFTDTRIFKDTHKSTHWQIAEDVDFQVLAHELNTIIFKYQYQVPPTALKFDKTYYVRAKFNGVRSESEWSDTLVLTTFGIIISKPNILTPSADAILNKDAFHFTSGAFLTEPVGDATHASSLWQLATSITFGTGAVVWEHPSTTDLTSVIVPVASLLPGTIYYMRVKYLSTTGESLWSSPVKVTSNYTINTPTIVSPTDNTIASRYNFKVQGSTYVTDPANVSPLLFTEVVLARDIGFLDVVQTFKQPGNTGNVDVASSYFDFNKNYYLKLRYFGNTSTSAWSAPIKITTDNVNILKPVVIEPLNTSNSSRISFRIRTQPFATLPVNDTPHISTIFQVSKSPDFNLADLVYNETMYTNLTTAIVPMTALENGRVYYVRVKFKGALGESVWSDTITTTIYQLGNLLVPVYTKRSSSDGTFGTDTSLVVGNVKCERSITDTNDAILFGKWQIADDNLFTVNLHEEELTIEPSNYPIKLIGSHFEKGKSYWLRVAYKTVASSDYSAWSEAIQITLGVPVTPTITNLDFLNTRIGYHDILVTGDLLSITEGYEDLNKRAFVQLSNHADFSVIDQQYTIDLPGIHLNHTCDVLRDIVYAKIKYEGHYFGETEWSEVLSVDSGNSIQPEVLTGEVVYEKINNVVTSFINATSSPFDVEFNREDLHLKSKWILSSDNPQTDIILDTGWIDSLTVAHLQANLIGETQLFLSVQYKGEYLGDGPISIPFAITKHGFVDVPTITSPLNNALVKKDEIILESSPFISEPVGLTHVMTTWEIRDSMGQIAWSVNTDIADDLTEIIVPDVLALGVDYKVRAKYKASDDAWSGWSPDINISTRPNVSKPVISSPVEASTVSDGGFLVSLTNITIDPSTYDVVHQLEYVIANDALFNDVVISSFSSNSTTSFALAAGLLSPSKTYHLKVRFIGYKVTSDWSDGISFITPVSSISKPSIMIPPNDSIVIGVSSNNLLKGNAFVSSANPATPHLKSTWEFSLNSDFSTIDKTIEVNSALGIDITETTITPWDLTPATTYHVRLQYSCGLSKSAFSDKRTFVTA